MEAHAVFVHHAGRPAYTWTAVCLCGWQTKIKSAQRAHALALAAVAHDLTLAREI